MLLSLCGVYVTKPRYMIAIVLFYKNNMTVAYKLRGVALMLPEYFDFSTRRVKMSLSCSAVGYRNWPRYGLRWSGLCCHSRHSTSGPAVARPLAAACGRVGRPTSAVPGVAAQTTTAQTVWVVNFYSTTKTKQNTTINPATVMTMSAMLNRPGWQRHCDDESVHRYSVWMIDQCDVTIASGSHIDDVTIAKLLTFEIISGAARNERYGFRLSKTTCRFNYKWAVVFCNGEYHQRLNSSIFQVPR